MANEPKDPSPSGDIVTRPLTGVLAITSVGSVGTVVDGVDPATGDYTINVNADGVRSKSQLKRDGSLSLEAQGAASVGRPGQARAIRTLCQRLEANGHVVTVEPGEDNRGEDGILTLNGLNYVLQLVTAPGGSPFWRQANAGVATSDVDQAGALEWMRSAIDAKARKIPPRERPRTVLALDAQHAGMLAADAVIAAYLNRFNSPKAEFGFAAVWVVGPTVPRCLRIGD